MAMDLTSPPRPGSGAVTRRNIELQALAVSAVNAREVPREILAPEFSMENRAFSVTDYTYRGATGWRDWMSDIHEEFTRPARYELEEIVAATDDFVVATFHIVGRSVRSRMPLLLCWTGVTWFRDGKLIRIVGYARRSEALQAAAESTANGEACRSNPVTVQRRSVGDGGAPTEAAAPPIESRRRYRMRGSTYRPNSWMSLVLPVATNTSLT